MTETVPAAGEPVQQTFAGMPTRLYAASPSRLLAWLDCPRRYRMTYLDRPRPPARPQRAHTSIGVATHNALRDYWDLAPADRLGGRGPRARTPRVGRRRLPRPGAVRPVAGTGGGPGAALPRRRRPARGTARHRAHGLAETRHARPHRPDRPARRPRRPAAGGRLQDQPRGADRRRRADLAAAGALRHRRRTHVPRPCTRVELHHVPTGSVAVHNHTAESLERKLAEAESIAARPAPGRRRLRRAWAGVVAVRRRAPSALCTWCDFRAHCPEGQQVGPEKSSWAALEGETA